MKIATVEVKVGLPDKLPNAAVSNGVDKMLDAGQADMVDVVFDCAKHPAINPRVAKDCVKLQVGDAEVVKISKGRPEPMEPVLTVTHLPALDNYFSDTILSQDPPEPVGTPLTPPPVPIEAMP